MTRYSHEVLKLTMEDWHTNAPFTVRDPVPIILTYTKTEKLGSASMEQSSLPISHGSISEAKLHEDANLLQRVQINSVYLSTELSTITGISFQIFPVW